VSPPARIARAVLLRARRELMALFYMRRVRHGRAPILTGRPRVLGGGRVELGDDVVICSVPVATQLIAEPGAVLRIGDETFMNYGVEIHAYESVTIGARALIGHYVHVMDSNGHGLVYRDAVLASPVVVEDEAWLGQRVTVLPGSRIGRGSVVATGSVVRGEIPPGVLAAGCPAVVLRPLCALDEARVARERAASPSGRPAWPLPPR
jgi:acetyltransferase-like isoleucine patch superfamily enzyme